jgi:flagellar biosynthetic protein FliR
MSAAVQQAILGVFLVFSRIGLCFLVLPGISSDRTPAQVRLFLAIAVSLAIAPIIVSTLKSAIPQNAGDLAPLLAMEALIGLLIGLLVRIFFVALEFAATAMASFLGYSSAFTHNIEGSDAATSLSAIVTIPAVVLFFLLDQHTKIVELLLNSYQSFPIGHPPYAQASLETLLSALATAFRLALQICAPLLVYSLVVNLVFGLLNKMVPQIPAYFISAPFLMFGGLIILYFLIGTIILGFSLSSGQSMLELLGGG